MALIAADPECGGVAAAVGTSERTTVGVRVDSKRQTSTGVTKRKAYSPERVKRTTFPALYHYISCYDRCWRTCVEAKNSHRARLCGLYEIRCFLRFSERVSGATAVQPQQHQLTPTLKTHPGGHQLGVGEMAEQLRMKTIARVD